MTQLMQGKRGLIMGVANDHSIAWGIARMLAAHGATLAFSYQGEALGRRVKPLAESVGASLLLPCDVEQTDSLDAAFAAIAEKWGSLDFLVHAVAFSDKNQLKGRYADPTRESFVRTMIISCFSFTEIARQAGLTDVTVQGKYVRFAPVELPESAVVRLNRIYPKSIVKANLRTILVPRPSTNVVGGQPIRDEALLAWAREVIDTVIDRVPATAQS